MLQLQHPINTVHKISSSLEQKEFYTLLCQIREKQFFNCKAPHARCQALPQSAEACAIFTTQKIKNSEQGLGLVAAGNFTGDYQPSWFGLLPSTTSCYGLVLKLFSKSNDKGLQRCW